MGIVQDKIQKLVYGESYVQKAQITFKNLKDDKGNKIKDNKWDVMLNPNSIRRRLGKQTKINRGAGKNSTDVKPVFREEHLSMQLVFDIVDAYDAYINYKDTKNLFFSMTNYGYLKDNRVAEEHKYPQKFRFLKLATTEDEITLENDEISCLPYLIYAAGSVRKDNDPECYVSFAWGGLSITGYITDLSIDYSYFSDKGRPLRAYVDLTIYRMPGKQVKKIQESTGTNNPLGGTNAAIKEPLTGNLDDVFNKKGYAMKDPFWYIDVGGQNITQSDKDIVIRNISVTLSTEFESSICTFTVSVPSSKYKHEENQVTFNEKFNKFKKLGSKIEVFMGYGDKNGCEPVFKGYIYTTHFNFKRGDICELEVEAMDVKAFMMKNQKNKEFGENSTGTANAEKKTTAYGQVVNNILADYSIYYENSNVLSRDRFTGKIYQINQSDYDFVVSLAKKLNYLFYVVNGTVYFCPYPSSSGEGLKMLTISPGDCLLDFSREATLADQVDSVTVKSNDESNAGEIIEGTANNATDPQESINPTAEKEEKVIMDPSVTSQDEATKLAKAELDRISALSKKGKFKLKGISGIEPGTYVQIKGISEDINEKYFITEVRHEMNESAYYTYCKFGAGKK